MILHSKTFKASLLSRQSANWHGTQEPAQLGFTSLCGLDLNHVLWLHYTELFVKPHIAFSHLGAIPYNSLPYSNQNLIYPQRPTSNASWNFFPVLLLCCDHVSIIIHNTFIVYLPIRLVSVLSGTETVSGSYSWYLTNSRCSKDSMPQVRYLMPQIRVS